MLFILRCWRPQTGTTTSPDQRFLQEQLLTFIKQAYWGAALLNQLQSPSQIGMVRYHHHGGEIAFASVNINENKDVIFRYTNTR